MDTERQHRLNAYFDGELPETEARAVREGLGRNPEERAALARMERLRGGCSGAHQTAVQPSWASVRNRLRQGDPALTRWNNLTYNLVSGLVAVLVLGLLLIGPRTGEEPDGLLLVDRVEMVETDLQGATSVVYFDEPSGWTVVWVLEEELPSEG